MQCYCIHRYLESWAKCFALHGNHAKALRRLLLQVHPDKTKDAPSALQPLLTEITHLATNAKERLQGKTEAEQNTEMFLLWNELNARPCNYQHAKIVFQAEKYEWLRSTLAHQVKNLAVDFPITLDLGVSGVEQQTWADSVLSFSDWNDIRSAIVNMHQEIVQQVVAGVPKGITHFTVPPTFSSLRNNCTSLQTLTDIYDKSPFNNEKSLRNKVFLGLLGASIFHIGDLNLLAPKPPKEAPKPQQLTERPVEEHKTTSNKKRKQSTVKSTLSTKAKKPKVNEACWYCDATADKRKNYLRKFAEFCKNAGYQRPAGYPSRCEKYSIDLCLCDPAAHGGRHYNAFADRFAEHAECIKKQKNHGGPKPNPRLWTYISCASNLIMGCQKMKASQNGLRTASGNAELLAWLTE